MRGQELGAGGSGLGVDTLFQRKSNLSPVHKLVLSPGALALSWTGNVARALGMVGRSRRTAPSLPEPRAWLRASRPTDRGGPPSRMLCRDSTRVAGRCALPPSRGGLWARGHGVARKPMTPVSRRRESAFGRGGLGHRPRTLSVSGACRAPQTAPAGVGRGGHKRAASKGCRCLSMAWRPCSSLRMTAQTAWSFFSPRCSIKAR